jgi:hypothetical protein
MAEGDAERFVLSETERNDALASLVRATSTGDLTLEDFSRRTDIVLRAETRAELVSATADVGVPAAALPAQRRWTLLIGTKVRRGRFVLPEETKAFILAGEIHVDLRGATLVGPDPTIKVTALAGSLRLLVPSGIHVEVDQTSLFGGRSIHSFGPVPSPLTPTLRVRMVDVLGSVKVTDDPHRFSPDLFPPRQGPPPAVAQTPAPEPPPLVPPPAPASPPAADPPPG